MAERRCLNPGGPIRYDAELAAWQAWAAREGYQVNVDGPRVVVRGPVTGYQAPISLVTARPLVSPQVWYPAGLRAAATATSFLGLVIYAVLIFTAHPVAATVALLATLARVTWLRAKARRATRED